MLNPLHKTRSESPDRKFHQQGLLNELDAPNLVQDYFTNLLSWNKDNIISTALNEEIFLLRGNYDLSEKKQIRLATL